MSSEEILELIEKIKDELDELTLRYPETEDDINDILILVEELERKIKEIL
ncbi:MAG: hypothetical protein ACTSYM_11845 [Candidatus Baldrarchaeia archaeon]